MDTIQSCDAEIARLTKRIGIFEAAPEGTHSQERTKRRDIRQLREERRAVKGRRALLFSAEKSKLFMHVAQRELPADVFGRVYAAYQAANSV